MPTSNRQVTHKTPTINPILALFATVAVLAAVLFVELTPEQKADPIRLRQDTRHDLQGLLDALRDE